MDEPTWKYGTDNCKGLTSAENADRIWIWIEITVPVIEYGNLGAH